ncbi:MAG TPA: hypothetical protein VFY93_04650 [Planctomycetota bacterium]|nr:hypothetical protein [Planctomycetota bacterium]
MRRLILLLAIAALAGCVAFGDPREEKREPSQDLLRPERPNRCLEALAAWLNEVASR